MLDKQIVLFYNFFSIFITKYGKFGPLDLEQNKLKIKAEWDPEIPIEALFQQINDAAEFAIYANHPIADNDKVQAAEALLLKTSSSPQEYKDWRSQLETDRTWDFFQEFWQIQYDLKHETETTAGPLGFGNQAVAESEEEQEYSETVANFSAGFKANSEVFGNLTETNSQMK